MAEITERENITPEGFVIDNDIKASWALRKIKEKKAEAERLIEFHKAAIKTIEDETAFDVGNLERLLRPYFDSVPHKITKTEESYKLPDGKIYVKKQAPEIKKDDKTVIAWLKEKNGGNFVKVETTETLDWKGLKEKGGFVGGTFVNEDGEVVPGIEAVEREAKFIIEV